MLNKTKIILVKELLDAGIPLVHIAQRLELNRDTIRVWKNAINEFGLTTFIDQYESAKKGQRVKDKLTLWSKLGSGT